MSAKHGGGVTVGGPLWGRLGGAVELCRVPAVLGGHSGLLGHPEPPFLSDEGNEGAFPRPGTDGRAPCLTVTQSQRTQKLEQTPSVFRGSAVPRLDTGLHRRAQACRGRGCVSPRPHSALGFRCGCATAGDSGAGDDAPSVWRDLPPAGSCA